MEPTRLVFLFAFLLFTFYLSTINSCEIYKFVPSQDQTLEGHVIKTVVYSLVNLCWRDCVWLSWCMSINVRPTNHNTVECDLNNSSKKANPGDLVPRQESQYHEMGAVDDQYCRMNQCKRKEDLGDGWFRYGKAAIKLFQQMKNWTDARIFCQSLGGDLLSITSSHENDFVYDVFVKGLNLTCEREKVRLVGGRNSSEGRVEIFHNGTWGTVCDDGWHLQDADVVCRQLGFLKAISAPSEAGFGEGSGQIWMDNVECSGPERDLSLCPFNGWGIHNCHHNEDAGVVCHGASSAGSAEWLEGVWIGLNDQANTNVFQWSDGTLVSQFMPLPDYNPEPVLSGRKCVAMCNNRKWLGKHCLEKKAFICEKIAS